MPLIYDWAAREAERTVTVADLKAARSSGRRYVQVTAETEEEASAAEEAGIDMLVTRAPNVAAVRRGSKRLFVTAALGFADAVTPDDILRTAFGCLTSGADAVVTSRGLGVVDMLAREDIPVMGHLGLVPRKSTWIGKLRAVGKTADEALELLARFRRLEDAGAFAAECEVIPAKVMEAIQDRTGLVTVSLGSGPSADVIFLFTADICGETDRQPRHARAYADLRASRARLQGERIAALRAFREDVHAGSFPQARELATIKEEEYAAFVAAIKEA